VLGPGGVGGDERQADAGLGDRGQLDLGLLGRLEQALQRLRVGPQVDAVVLGELVGQVVHDPAVEVVPAQVGVAGRGAHFDHAVADVQDAHVEGPAAQVEDQDGLVLLLVQAVGQRGRGGLVDDAEHLEPGDAAGVPGRLALGVVEVGRHGDDGLVDLLAEELRRVLDQLAQDQRGDFLRRVLPALDLEPHRAVGPGNHVERHRVQLAGHLVVAPPDEPLGGVDRSLRVQDRLPPGQLADQALALGGEGHHRGSRARSLRVRYHRRLTGHGRRDHRVGGAKVNSDGDCHHYLLSGCGVMRGRMPPARCAAPGARGSRLVSP
jgi:hypothetical protein